MLRAALMPERRENLVVKGRCDLTKHFCGHNSRIHALINTRFHTNVLIGQNDEVMTFTQKFKGQLHRDIIMSWENTFLVIIY